jgi:hypothetical protein
MIDIALAKKWKLENIEPNGDEAFINEANRQIAKLIEKESKTINIDTEIIIIRAKTELQQQNINMKDKEFVKTINISELKVERNEELQRAIKRTLGVANKIRNTKKVMYDNDFCLNISELK